MSYILDALRRAESERERGTVPRLHTQSEAALSAEEGSHSPRARRLRLGLVLGLLLGLIALVLVFGLGQVPWRSAEQPAAQAASPNVAPTPAATVAAVKSPVVPPLTTPAKPAESANPVARPTTAPSVPFPVASSAVPPAVLPVVPPTTPLAVAAATAKPAAIPALSALPESLRRELPPLVTGGAMYSDTPANRMLIINGQVLREGDQVAPQLVLEQIKLKAAVLVYKGERFSINF